MLRRHRAFSVSVPLGAYGSASEMLGCIKANGFHSSMVCLVNDQPWIWEPRKRVTLYTTCRWICDLGTVLDPQKRLGLGMFSALNSWLCVETMMLGALCALDAALCSCICGTSPSHCWITQTRFTGKDFPLRDHSNITIFPFAHVRPHQMSYFRSPNSDSHPLEQSPFRLLVVLSIS